MKRTFGALLADSSATTAPEETEAPAAPAATPVSKFHVGPPMICHSRREALRFLLPLNASDASGVFQRRNRDNPDTPITFYSNTSVSKEKVPHEVGVSPCSFLTTERALGFFSSVRAVPKLTLSLNQNKYLNLLPVPITEPEDESEVVETWAKGETVPVNILNASADHMFNVMNSRYNRSAFDESARSHSPAATHRFGYDNGKQLLYPSETRRDGRCGTYLIRTFPKSKVSDDPHHVTIERVVNKPLVGRVELVLAMNGAVRNVTVECRADLLLAATGAGMGNFAGLSSMRCLLAILRRPDENAEALEIVALRVDMKTRKGRPITQFAVASVLASKSRTDLLIPPWSTKADGTKSEARKNFLPVWRELMERGACVPLSLLYESPDQQILVDTDQFRALARAGAERHLALLGQKRADCAKKGESAAEFEPTKEDTDRPNKLGSAPEAECVAALELINRMHDPTTIVSLTQAIDQAAEEESELVAELASCFCVGVDSVSAERVQDMRFFSVKQAQPSAAHSGAMANIGD